MRLACLFAALAAGCFGQFDTGSIATRWADYYAVAYRVPRELVYSVIEVESGWQTRAVSEKGAAGLMQLMPSTAAAFGVADRFEIAQNIRGGVAYLSHLLRLFKGDLRLVLAAYVSGEERILSAGLAYSNAEVFEYVVKVTALYRARRLKRVVQGGGSP